MGLYAKYVVPRMIDFCCGLPPMTELREQYVPKAKGKVLEIGIGTGHNLAHYQEADSITGLDPAPELTEKAAARAAESKQEVRILQVSCEEIPAPTGAFDSIVCTWTLCSIPNVYRALDEMRRVLKPSGRFYFIEHGLSPEAGIVRWQRALEPLWKRIGGGCHLTRQPTVLLRSAGFKLLKTRTSEVPGPKFATFMTHGVATR